MRISPYEDEDAKFLSEKQQAFDTYVFTYLYQGREWDVYLKAETQEDAQARLVAMQHGKPLMEIYPDNPQNDTFLCQYPYQGEDWKVFVVALDLEDAQARLVAMQHGKSYGKVYHTVGTVEEIDELLAMGLPETPEES